MKSKLLITCLLAGCVSAAPRSGADTALALLPPPFLKVRVERVEVQGVCVEPRSDYFLYISRRGNYYSALITGVDGTPRYEGAPVQAENCGDSSLAWPDAAIGFVRASTSPTGRVFPQLVVPARSLQVLQQPTVNLGQLDSDGVEADVQYDVPNACQLTVDLTLREGYQCAPPNRGQVE